MITDLDRTEPVAGSRPAWLLPLVAALCVAAFIGLAATTREGPAAAPAAATPAAAPARQVAATPGVWVFGRDGQTGVAIPGQPIAGTAASLAFPPGAYSSVTRVAGSVTTGLYPADEEALTQLRYRLPDDRVAVLVRLPRSDPLRGIEPASYTASTVVVRGIEARVLTGRTAVEPTILLWGEGSRAYQLYSSVHSVAELAQLAEQLR